MGKLLSLQKKKKIVGCDELAVGCDRLTVSEGLIKTETGLPILLRKGLPTSTDRKTLKAHKWHRRRYQNLL